MGNITLGQVQQILVFIVALIGSIEYLSMRLRKWLKIALKEEIEPINNKINKLELNSDKNFLVRFLTDVEQNKEIDEVEWSRFDETYERYHQLGGNSYIDHKVDKLKKIGKIL